MAKIKPLRPIIYNTEKVDISKVIMPPYDIIKNGDIEKYYKLSPYNIIRIDKAKDVEKNNKIKNKYIRAADYIKKWLREKILIREKKAGIYIYAQEYYLPDNTKKEMIGFFANVRLEEFEKKIILPHEKTHSGPKQDRLELMRQTKANTSAVLSLYFDEKREIDSILREHIKIDTPIIDFCDVEKIRYRMWKLENEKVISEIKKFFYDKQLFIADGHHRYETALNFRNEMRKKGYKRDFNYILMCLVSMEHSGISILPTHRVFKNFLNYKFIMENKKMKKYFFRRKIKDIKELKIEMADEIKKSIGVASKNEQSIIILKIDEYKELIKRKKQNLNYNMLDVTILHDFIFKEIFNLEDEFINKNIYYTQDIEEAIEKVKKEKYKIAFLLKPTTVNEVKEVSLQGEVMPQKSTYFLPKLATGFIINPLY